jgi:hypothetical protein
LILFYDEDQSIKPSDVQREDFDRLKINPRTKVEQLKSQFRVRGGNDYVKFIDRMLNVRLLSPEKFISQDYEFLLFDSIEDILSEIKKREQENGLSRMVAGYSWKWISKNDYNLTDIAIDGTTLRWNSVASDWVNSVNSINEVGCIHTTQGYDLNYTGIIFGNEISYDKDTDQIVIRPENYHDINGKQSIKDPAKLKSFILNIYKTIMLRGIKGTYLYACDPDLREYLAKHVHLYKQPTKSSLWPMDEVVPYENSVPIYDLKAAAGNFSEPQHVSDHEWIRLPLKYTASNDLFACTVVGESMNKIIPNGSVCLFRKYYGGSRDGLIVLVEHSSIQDRDFGSGYTVKEYRSKKHSDDSGWSHSSILLKPLSHDSTFEALELGDDELKELNVVGIFECVLE